MFSTRVSQPLMVSVAAVVASALLPLFLLWQRPASANSLKSHRDPVQPVLVPFAFPPAVLDAGRQADTDAYIERVRKESFEECLEKLDGTEPLLSLILTYHGEPMPEVTYQRCLGDRRLAKVYENLAKRDAAEARSFVSSFHAKSWQTYYTDIDRCLDQWEADGKVAAPVPLSKNYRVLCASVFLVSIFDSHDELITAIDDWQSFSTVAMQRVFENPKLKVLRSEMGTYCPPQPLFLVNVYMNRILDQCTETSPEELLAGLTPQPMVTWSTAYTGWDGRINSFDSNHRLNGIPVDEKRTLRHFEVVRSWSPAAVHTPEQKSVVIDSLREKLEKCEKDNGR